MKYGVNAFLWTAAWGRGNLTLLPRVRELGFDGIELVGFEFGGFPAVETRRALEQNSMGCTFCTALTGDMSLGTDDATVRGKTRQFLTDAIKVAAESGSQVLAGPFCSAVGLIPGRRRTEDEWKRAVEGLQEVAPVAAGHGITLAIEPLNRFETYFLTTVDEGVKLCQEVGSPAVGLLVDTFHSNIEEKNIPAAYRKAGKYLKHVHTCENDRGEPGSGHVDWAGVMAALKEVGYDGWLVIESFGSQVKEIATAACIWRDLAPSAEALAAEGLKFLKAAAAKTGK
jgi:D-psicose/D-tagatose/L-ribulose 3-epimerase